MRIFNYKSIRDARTALDTIRDSSLFQIDFLIDF